MELDHDSISKSAFSDFFVVGVGGGGGVSLTRVVWDAMTFIFLYRKYFFEISFYFPMQEVL